MYHNGKPIESFIKNVAVYLRKSRGDDEGVLIKHKTELISLCNRFKWRYVEYAEIGSGDSIILRPQMQKLLKDIEEGLFDAVVVHDWDRLGRGDLSEQGKIFTTLKRTSTLVVTANPYHVYDLNNEQDEQYTDFQSFLARQEYKMIKKRLIQGKKIGSKLGNWTNGTPPFPYDYDPQTKGLVVNQEKLPIYRLMVEQYLSGKSLYNIAWELNKMGIRSPRNRRWREQVIKRILVDETHLGKIISNKTEGDAHKVKRPSSKEFRVLPRSEWIVVENCHEPVKTQEEHDLILKEMKRRSKVPSSRNIFPLSGLVKCGFCGKTMSFYSGDRLKPCNKIKDDLSKCANKGGEVKFIYEEINNQIFLYREQIYQLLKEDEGSDHISLLSKAIEQKDKEIQLKETALEKIQEGWELGMYTASEARKRIEKIRKEIGQLEEELTILQSKFEKESSIENEERLSYLDQVFAELKKKELSGEKLNELYKMIIDNIIWKRTGDTVEIEINFM